MDLKRRAVACQIDHTSTFTAGGYLFLDILEISSVVNQP